MLFSGRHPGICLHSTYQLTLTTMPLYTSTNTYQYYFRYILAAKKASLIWISFSISYEWLPMRSGDGTFYCKHRHRQCHNFYFHWCLSTFIFIIFIFKSSAIIVHIVILVGYCRFYKHINLLINTTECKRIFICYV